jgi:hypothetical protein
VKAFKITSRPNKGQITVECPRKDCGGRFTVYTRRWAESSPMRTRACTYCFRVSEMPAKRNKKKSS